ncbi:D-Ala-D-Ala carboxypeptidase family metallohydrolase [Microvirga sp. CF3016]|uniref:D-Ala-D-Ala carboxypeptidase family metallohydrolase n=1 Tax=Microvirga sp. CF3016 TaxID=3110181 RepID=UPI002E79D887|nr:D-Ala-D-Ala carboxypeptidase family metallohydrolase [Microvirga sp. CF3016]MEE1611636.1 D-Ala-D-Ala carboxypeptidase family metallohydrolase [Microvirga sp. CF3016]
MSIVCRARHASRMTLIGGAFLLALSPAALRAGDGDSGIIPPAQYASLPTSDQIDEPDVTGSLPNARALSGFASLVSHGTITLRESAPTKCIPGDLREVVASVAEKFGPVSIESTHRTRGRNWRAGGARQSLHLSCRAVDFRVRARARGVMAFLRAHPQVGGLKVYRNGIIHIDNGERRSW